MDPHEQAPPSRNGRGRWALRLAASGAIVFVAPLGVTVASGDHGSAHSPGPTLPSGVASDRSEALDRMPDRVLVSTLDGGILRRADGTPVTVPVGQLQRGEITRAEADRQFADIDRLQRLDACLRGVEIPVSVSVEGAFTHEEIHALAKTALADAITANGGRRTESAC